MIIQVIFLSNILPEVGQNWPVLNKIAPLSPNRENTFSIRAVDDFEVSNSSILLRIAFIIKFSDISCLTFPSFKTCKIISKFFFKRYC